MNTFAKYLRIALQELLKFLVAAWVFGLIWYNAPLDGIWIWSQFLAILWIILFYTIPFIPRLRKFRLLIPAVFALPFLIVYLSLRPSNDRKWELSCQKTPSVEISGNTITVRNFRNFDYTKGGKPIPEWEDREFDLSKLVSMDIFLTHWGSELIAHPIFSFDFGEDGHLAFSIEARREEIESYSVLGGLYRRYELLYIPCSETDAVRVRSNIRKNETVYIYRTVATPLQARARLLEFLETTNRLREQPKFYNVLFSNCTTAVRSQIKGGFAFDWRIILNGRMDKMLYDRGMFETGGLSFKDLKEHNFVNPAARKHPQIEGYSDHIRKDRAGFP
ncbi:DUF4105 domain-containing protein [Luteolibacter sp. AS25]|uniref:Lnb N-terminal periplasmic domain-containing protein n=1 Tax=Luteolibacter sp. AS25 TaxID=3135776 RepID=UPI00398A743F